MKWDIEIRGVIIEMTRWNATSLLQCDHMKGHQHVPFLTLVLRFIRFRFGRSHGDRAEQTQRPRAAVRLQVRGVREEVLLGVGGVGERGERARRLGRPPGRRSAARGPELFLKE